MMLTRCETCIWWDPLPEDDPLRAPRQGLCHSRESRHAMIGKPVSRSWCCVWWAREPLVTIRRKQAAG